MISEEDKANISGGIGIALKKQPVTVMLVILVGFLFSAIVYTTVIRMEYEKGRDDALHKLMYECLQLVDDGQTKMKLKTNDKLAQHTIRFKPEEYKNAKVDRDSDTDELCNDANYTSKKHLSFTNYKHTE